MTAASTDVAVIGGGVMGAAAARAMAERGVSVVVFDRHPAGHGHGSSHGDGRIVRATYAEPAYVSMARRAFDAWYALERSTGETLIDGGGILEIGPLASSYLASLAATLDTQGVSYERLDAAGVHERFPQLMLPRSSEALYQGEGGTVRADVAQRVLWQQARDAGVEIRREVGVTGLSLEHGRVRIETDGLGVHHARRLVVTAGAWTNRVLASLDVRLPLVVTQEQVAYLPVRPGGGDHGTGVLPSVLDHRADPNFYALPRIGVDGVKVGRHRSGPAIEPDVPGPRDPVRLRQVVAWARATLPGLVPEPFGVTPCLYTNTPDFDFVIDRLDRAPSVIVGAGFSGHGFKFAPVVGEMLAALALDEADPVPRTPFRIDRFL